ncbi:MAG: AgmX/PglI C-terminal domain-containing protein [Polyangiaceae bacterium]|nr:AgmX/PglI C-terminal domain-containing protein [Polyangiaceae bacterium]
MKSSLSERVEPGTLTSVMATAGSVQSRTKALRVGLVHKGKVVDERVIDPGKSVTVGPNEKATFVINDRSLPPNFKLFESHNGTFRLCVTAPIVGKVVQDGGSVEFGSSTHISTQSIDLKPDARGKLTIGEHVVLFQLVIPTPPLGKPALPESVKSSATDVDWRTSMIAAFSFLFHFGAVGTVYSDWMDPVVDDEVDTAQLIESVRNLPAPPPLERPKEETNTPQAANSAQAAAKPASGGGRAVTAGAAGGGGGGKMGDNRAHQIASQLQGLEVAMLTALNSQPGSATSSVLSQSGDLPMGLLDKAAASAMGTKMGGPGGLDLGGTTGTPIRPGQIARGIIGNEGSIGPATAGSGGPVRPPSGGVATSPPTVINDELPGASRVVAGMTPGFRRCYNAGLTNEDPTMKGTVRVTAKIGPNGEVTSATASGGGTLSATVIGCIRNRVASAQFDRPANGSAVVIIPVSLFTQ